MVDITQLTKRYGDLTAVANVSFEVRQGETLALLGPNGSGKTTILKCLAGLTFATSGTMSINGIDTAKDASGAKSQLSYLPQRVAFPENLTARELIRFYSRLRRLPEGRAEWVLRTYGFVLNGFMDKPTGEYSGGMVQRLGVAISLLPDVPVLVLDEPAVNLDPEGAIRFKQALQSIGREGKTILFSSHRLSEVALLAQRVAVLVSGRLVALDTVVHFQNELSAGVKLRIVLKNPGQGLAAVADLAGASLSRLLDSTLVVTCSPEQRISILRAIEQAGGEIESFSTDDATLEEVYLNYVHANAFLGPDPDVSDGLRERSTPAGRDRRG